MEIEELMIGDWVYDKTEGTPFQMTRKLLSYYLTYPIAVDKLEPIPLSKDILTNNGFEAETDDCYALRIEDDNDYFLIQGWYTVSDKIPPYIQLAYGSFADLKYTHQLQHALRLCGLTELANNIKVTLWMYEN